MTKLEKSFQDYFRIPILLRCIGKTSEDLIIKLSQSFNNSNPKLVLDERYHIKELPNSNKLKQRPLNTIQQLKFRVKQFNNDWSQFQPIYWCRFVIGVIDINQQLDIEASIEKFKKQIKDEGRKFVGIILIGSIIPNNIAAIENVIVLPEKIPQSQIWSFLEPWIYNVLRFIQIDLVNFIGQLKNQYNDIIVFNKNQQKPQPKTIKRKKRGRCLKICGDMALVLKLFNDAYSYYLEAQQILRKIEDYLWLFGVIQGKMACFTSEQDLPIEDRYTLFQQHATQSINLVKKTKIYSFETENYFKIFKIFINQPSYLDQLINNYLMQNLRYHVETEKFNIYLQIGRIYQKAGMNRKRNYYYYQAALINLQKRPQISQLLLKEIKANKNILQWPQLYSKLIKLIISTHQNSNGSQHLQLLQNCSGYINKNDLISMIDVLNFSHFSDEKFNRMTTLFNIKDFYVLQSNIKPKVNKLIYSQANKSPGKSFFMQWKKKQQILQYQYNEIVKIFGVIVNKMNFSMKLQISIPYNNEKKIIPLFLMPRQHLKFQKQVSFSIPDIETNEPFEINTLNIKVWNFQFVYTVPKPLKFQFYEQTSYFSIETPTNIIVESSSFLGFPIKINKIKKQIGCFMVKLNISVYYTLEVGFQQNQFIINDQCQQLLVVENGYQDKGQIKTLILKPFKQQRKYLKKIQYTLQYITNQQSKFQISIVAQSLCEIRERFSLKLLSLSSNVFDHLKIIQLKDEHKIIQQNFIAKLLISKQQNDLTPYKIIINDKQYTLTDRTSLTIDESISKCLLSKIQHSSIKIRWENIINPYVKGSYIESLQFHELMLKPNKVVEFHVQQIESSKKKLKTIKMRYQIKGSSLSHQILISPILSPNKQQYALKGKNKIKTNEQSYKNEVTLTFNRNYNERYILGLNFEDGWKYFYFQVFNVHSFNN